MAASVPPDEETAELSIEPEVNAAANLAAAPEVDEWGALDIEEAYQKALRAMEELGDEVSADETRGEEAVSIETVDGADAPALVAAIPDVDAVDSTSDSTRLDAAHAGPVLPASDAPPSLRIAAGTEIDENLQRSQVTPKQVIEAALFVGGSPITAKKLCSLLRGSFQPDVIEQLIDELNVEYSAQERPYEIRLGDGGYRLELRPEFDRLRQRVFGMGPREVKLSQEVLEVLAVVAYRQPLNAQEIEAVKPNSGNVLRQLIRRDLVGITRGERKRSDVTYHTTERFLSLFGLGSLDELPRPEDIAVK